MRGERAGAVVLLAAATLGFLWILAPFRSAVVWAIAASVLFAPLFHLLERRLGGHRNLAAALSVVAMILAFILPAILAGAALVRETGTLIAEKGGAARLPTTIAQLHAMLPDWLHGVMRLTGGDDLASFQHYVARLLEGGIASLFGGAIGLGQGAFGFAVSLGVMIYASFFFIRDGQAIVATVVRHLPLQVPIRDRLIAEVGGVLRATLRGSLIVAVVQGTVGGCVFWALGIPAPAVWAFAMAFMSLLPPFGAGAVWVPVAAFLLLTGSTWQGLTLIVCGLFVIGLVDNLLRPLLVGREARLPEYLVLLSTLGGLTLLGLDGIIIGPMIVAVFLVSWQAMAPPVAARPHLRASEERPPSEEIERRQQG
ncbi:MAG: AI-2E family transporter [Sphingomonas sp.]